MPPDPLSDHRRRHGRELPQQRPHLRLDPVHSRVLLRLLVPRRLIRGQRRPNRTLRHARMHVLRDRPDRLPRSAVLPADLCPVVHCDHPFQGPGRGSKVERRYGVSSRASPTVLNNAGHVPSDPRDPLGLSTWSGRCPGKQSWRRSTIPTLSVPAVPLVIGLSPGNPAPLVVWPRRSAWASGWNRWDRRTVSSSGRAGIAMV